MQFLHPALTAGFFLALLPLLIHLINMMRHRRVKWAAMEFLLQSYKKHRKWVWLRQLILLLARMAAVALIVAMLAQLVTQRRYEGLFGSTLTHHYVVIDDSMSMSDRAGGMDALEQALELHARTGRRGGPAGTAPAFHACCGSRKRRPPAQSDPDSGLAAAITDLNAEDVDSGFPLRLEAIRTAIRPTQLPVGPEAALQVLRRFVSQNNNEHRILYLVSDFRAKEWDNPREIRELLSELEKEDVQIRLVNCVRAPAHQPGRHRAETGRRDAGLGRASVRQRQRHKLRRTSRRQSAVAGANTASTSRQRRAVPRWIAPPPKWMSHR